MTNKKTDRYTYVKFAKEIIEIMAGKVTISPEIAERITAKAQDLLATQNAKAEYNKNKPKTSKGPSETTLKKAETIFKGISKNKENARTATEINEFCGTNYSALEIANAVKYMKGVKITKVIRTTTNKKGLTGEKEYTAYYTE